MISLFDMHCHLDFASNTHEAVSHLDALGVGAFAVSVLPSGLDVGISGSEEEFPTPGKVSSDPEIPTDSLVRFGVGLHPWWVADGRASAQHVDAAVAAVASTNFVGEIGLDYGKTHGANQRTQRSAFERVVRAAALAGNRVLSIHAVNAADDALDVLKATGAIDNCACIFHWFSDNADALHRAVRAGCYFSVGDFMLQSRRGREYARQIPLSQLLLETDYPPEGQPYAVAAMQAQLSATLRAICHSRGANLETLADTINQTSSYLLLSS